MDEACTSPRLRRDARVKRLPSAQPPRKEQPYCSSARATVQLAGARSKRPQTPEVGCLTRARQCRNQAALCIVAVRAVRRSALDAPARRLSQLATPSHAPSDWFSPNALQATGAWRRQAPLCCTDKMQPATKPATALADPLARQLLSQRATTAAPGARPEQRVTQRRLGRADATQQPAPKQTPVRRTTRSRPSFSASAPQ